MELAKEFVDATSCQLANMGSMDTRKKMPDFPR